MHENARLLFEKHAKSFFKPGMRILEIGPDGDPSTIRKMVPYVDIQWHTLDIYDAPFLTYPNSELYSFAIPDNTYDIVCSANVIEHVTHIWRWLPELSRVTKVNGHVITINPTSWPFHEYPVDCWRIFPDGMAALCEDSGLEVEFSFFGSLEQPEAVWSIPGRSLEWQPTRSPVISALLKALKVPTEKSFDTITIARKSV